MKNGFISFLRNNVAPQDLLLDSSEEELRAREMKRRDASR
jgi:hypothetical protein